MSTLKIPYGLSDFQSIMQEHYFYQDRTDKIPLIEQVGKQLLFIRPRRFGKSLLLSMLENYYDLNKAEQFTALFGQLAIGQNPTPLRNQYFVLKWDFSTIAAHGSIADIESAIHRHINICIERCAAQYQLAVSINQEDAVYSFGALLNAVKMARHPLYLLIDEYDNFANEVMMAEKSHYQALLYGEGLLKTVFKMVKSASSGLGLDRVFITGVSPIVMSDMTSGYNVATNIYLEPEFNDLCGFTETEVQQLFATLSPEYPSDEALTMMRTFYNGYRFHHAADQSVYNPTLSLYFLKAWQKQQTCPDNLLDENLAMDRNKLKYISRLAHGEQLIVAALSTGGSISVPQLAERFGVEDMLYALKDQTFMASLLYFFGILTLSGTTVFNERILTIPNLVVRKLYVERLRDLFLSDYNDRQTTQIAAKTFCQTGNLQPLCDFIEQRYFKILSNRDYRWSNELILKIAFMTLLYNDNLYMMVSETESNRRYVDLSLIVRPDKRQFEALDLVLEFKYLNLPALKLSAEQLRQLSSAELIALPAVSEKLQEATIQAQDYLQQLQAQYPAAKLHGFVVVALGFERVLWQAV